MKPHQESIQLKFNCQEDLEAMSCTDQGKFCTACQKEVIDFTQKSYLEIQRIREDQPEMCGIFLTEQLDPSLHPIQLPKVRSWAFLSSILVSLNFGSISAQTQLDSNSEQISLRENSFEPVDEELPNSASTQASLPKNIDLVASTEMDREDRKRKRRYKKYQRKKLRTWYWSWRFPFVRKKPIRSYGIPRWL